MKAAERALRAGDWVEIRSREELLATLTDGSLDELPLMPQMLDLAGQRFQVAARAHKTCDTVNRTGGRRLRKAVHLVGSRCDGEAYDGCRAACLIFWKTAWLRRADGPGPHDPADVPVPVSVGRRSAEQQVWDATRAPASTADDTIYSCQATRLPAFTTPLPWWDVRQYIQDITSGNVRVREVAAGAAYVSFYTAYRAVRRLGLHGHLAAMYDAFQRRRRGVPFPRRHGRLADGPTPTRNLDLEPGDEVRVRPYDEILGTLNGHNRNRGMFFDAEEVPYCGERLTVRHRVDKIVDERTGRMIPIAGNTVVLDGAVCLGHYSDRRMFCPRKIYSFWREVWLERV